MPLHPPHEKPMHILVQQALKLVEIIDGLDQLVAYARNTAEMVHNTLKDVQHQLASLMASTGTKRIRFKGWTINLRHEEDVVVDDPDRIPDDLIFIETEISRNPLWGKIRWRLRHGTPVPGAHLVKHPATVTLTRQK